ncbi:DUF4326 domain-containing protein [Nocardia fluminea]|uniref:Uncharacterized protein DUF4326 n=1 Tax=Nocardia fluminea TaxID=134984 RepID=A0A2N3VGY2_9NOCA|nr:DUF4326 domain-containing protein [Nocardia fluminea]PKV80882.1 uncharacterized protein DUF4326 [Nocardia fluminea]
MADRVQLRRTKGWRLPDGAVNVARPGRWGNPYVVHQHTDKCGDDHVWCPTYCADDRETAVRLYRHAVLHPLHGQPRVPTPDEIRTELAGRDLACWCLPAGPCHADFLIEIANTEEKTDG